MLTNIEHHDSSLNPAPSATYDMTAARSNVGPGALRPAPGLKPTAQLADEHNNPTPQGAEGAVSNDAIADAEAKARNADSIGKTLSKSALLNDMAEVKLSDAESHIYNCLLTPRGRLSPNYRQFYKATLPSAMLSISAAINKLFLSLRTVAITTTEEAAVEPDVLFDKIDTAVAAFESHYIEEARGAKIDQYCNGVATGTKHIIYPSNDGKFYNIEFSGFSPESQDLAMDGICAYYDKDSWLYTNDKDREHSRFDPTGGMGHKIPDDRINAVTNGCLTTGLQLLQALFPDSLTRPGHSANAQEVEQVLMRTAHRRLRQEIRLTDERMAALQTFFDGQKINYRLDNSSKVYSVLLDKVFQQESGNPYRVPKSPTFDLSEYFRVVLYREPYPSVAKAYVDTFNGIMDATPVVATDNLQGLAQKVNTQWTEALHARIRSNDQLIGRAELLLQPIITCSFMLRIPVGIAKFITQNPNVSLFSLNSWISTWVRATVQRTTIKNESANTSTPPLDPDRVPLFVYPLSKMSHINALRQKSGYAVEEGKTNEDDLFINSDGRLNFCPKTSMLNTVVQHSNIAKTYENLVESYLANLYSKKIPFSHMAVRTNTVLDSSTVGSELIGATAYENINLLSTDGAGSDGVSAAQTLLMKRARSRSLRHIRGALLGYSWEHNVIATAGPWENSGLIEYKDLSGTAKPDTLAIAQYLGYKFGTVTLKDEQQNTHSEDIMLTAGQAFHIMFPGERVRPGGTKASERSMDASFNIAHVASTSVIHKFINAYCLFLLLGKMQGPQHLITDIAKVIKLPGQDTCPWATLDRLSYEKTPVDWIRRVAVNDRRGTGARNLYSEVMTDDFKTVASPTASIDKIRHAAVFIKTMLDLAVREAIGAQNDSRGILQGLVTDKVFTEEQRQEYTLRSNQPLANFGNIYKFFGGKVFWAALHEFLTGLRQEEVLAGVKDLTRTSPYAHINVRRYNAGQPLQNGIVAEDALLKEYTEATSILTGYPKLYRPSFTELSTIVYPFCIMLHKYVPAADIIFKEAKDIIERNRTELNIKDTKELNLKDVSLDISKDRTRTQSKVLFPHQMRAERRLAQDPRVAILSISAGGGKTITYLVEAARQIERIRDQRTAPADPKDPNSAIKRSQPPLRPLIVCPDNLVRSVCNEMSELMGNTWNVVPLTTGVVKSWGDGSEPFARLDALLDDTPIGTLTPSLVLVAGYNFLSTQRVNLYIGNRVTPLYGALEFIKKLRCNYIVFDESHFLKNPESNRSLIAKLLASGSNVEFIRLATGTLHPNSGKDIMGQTALFASNVFRTSAEFKGQYYIDPSARDNNSSLREDASARINHLLSSFSSMIVFKRRDWAHLYPDLVTKFVPVGLIQGTRNPDGSLDALESLHQKMYHAIRQSAIAEFTKEVGLSQERDSAYDNSDDENVSDEGGLDTFDPGAGSELERVKKKIVKFWLQRLEQVVIDPFNDNMFEEFGKSDVILEEDKAKELESFHADYARRRTVNEDLKKKALKELNDKYEELHRLSAYLNTVRHNLADPSSAGGPSPKDNYFSPKVMYCVHNAVEHFSRPDSAPLPQYQSGGTYRAYAKVSWKGDTYIARRLDNEERGAKFKSLTISPEPDRWYQEVIPGRIIFICSYTRTANLLFRALTSSNGGGFDSSEVGLYIGTGKESENVIADFINPTSSLKVLIANEKKITVGHNLQIASKIVRVETPWTPGDLEQTESRIFRPDPKSTSRRPVVYIDWLLSNETMEVPKILRLIWKMVESTKLDEADNTSGPDGSNIYTPILSSTIDPIAMNLSTFEDLQDFNGDLARPYVDVHSSLIAIQQQDIDMARKTSASTPPVVLESNGETPADYQAMPFKPLVIGQIPRDVSGVGSVRLTDYLMTHKNDLNNILVYPHTSLNNRLVFTQFGTAVITGVEVNYVKDDKNPDSRVVNANAPIASVSLSYRNVLEGVNKRGSKSVDPRLIYIITNIAEAQRLGLDQNKSLGLTRIKTSGIDRASLQSKQLEIARRLVGRQAATLQKQAAKTILPATDATSPTPVTTLAAPVIMYPVLVNGYYALVARDSDHPEVEGILLNHGFVRTAPYLYAQAATVADLLAIVSDLFGRMIAHGMKLSVEGNKDWVATEAWITPLASVAPPTSLIHNHPFNHPSAAHPASSHTTSDLRHFLRTNMFSSGSKGAADVLDPYFMFLVEPSVVGGSALAHGHRRVFRLCFHAAHEQTKLERLGITGAETISYTISPENSIYPGHKTEFKYRASRRKDTLMYFFDPTVKGASRIKAAQNQLTLLTNAGLVIPNAVDILETIQKYATDSQRTIS
jgi:SNF2 family DNA or RNA helicase